MYSESLGPNFGFIKVVLDPITIDDTTQSKIRDIETPSTNTIYVV